MKLIFLNILFLLNLNLFFGQEKIYRDCNLKYEIDTTNLQKSKTLKIYLTNLENSKLKIPKTFDMMRVQAYNLEKFDENSKTYKDTTKGGNFDVNCPKCNDKLISLKPNKKHEYKIDITKQYLLEKVLSEPNKKYKFELHFETIDFFSDNKKCHIEDFKTSKINYTTP